MNRQEGTRRNKTRNEIKLLISARLRTLEQSTRGSALMPLSLRKWEEEILEDVLERANGHFDQASLLRLIDLCIREDELHAQVYQERSLKSFYGFRARFLRLLKPFLLRYLNPKRWVRKRRK
jgi:hypothetical protein